MKTLTLLCTLLLSACATSPDKIVPYRVSTQQYAGYDCEALTLELDATRTNLSRLNAAQRKSHGADVVWVTVGTFLLWPAYFGLLATDDHKDEIAKVSGEYLAMVDSQSRCSSADASDQR
jgi:hypothetical protein